MIDPKDMICFRRWPPLGVGSAVYNWIWPLHPASKGTSLITWLPLSLLYSSGAQAWSVAICHVSYITSHIFSLTVTDVCWYLRFSVTAKAKERKGRMRPQVGLHSWFQLVFSFLIFLFILECNRKSISLSVLVVRFWTIKAQTSIKFLRNRAVVSPFLLR